LNGRIIELYVFEETLNGAIYHNFLENNLPILLENVELHIFDDKCGICKTEHLILSGQYKIY